MNAQRKAIKARNEERKHPRSHRDGCFSKVEYSESAFGTCSCYDVLADSVTDDIDTLLAELAAQDAEIERLTNRLQRSA